LIQNQVQLFWLVFGAFLISETVLLGGVAQLLSIVNLPKFWIFFSSLFGLILCIPWWTTYKYNHAFYLLRIDEAKKMEKEKLVTEDFFSNGEKLSKGEPIPFSEASISKIVKWLKPEKAIAFLICMYGIAFFVIMITMFNMSELLIF
jgi:hypothetical protein